MSVLFMNEKDFDDLKEEIQEDFGLKPKNDEKKQSVEDRIIGRCNLVQAACSSALDYVPYYGSIKSAIECKTGKDFITDEKLTTGERVMCGVGAVIGGTHCLAKAANLGGISRALIDVASDLEGINSLANDVPNFLMDNGHEIINEIDQYKARNQQNNKSRSRNKSKSRSRSRSRDKSKNKNKKEKKVSLKARKKNEFINLFIL